MQEVSDRDSWQPGTPIESNAYNWTNEPVVLEASRSIADGARIAIDLFCGCGGFSEGFRAAGFQAALAADIHPPSLATYRKNHPEATAILGDLRKVDEQHAFALLGGRQVDVIAAGVPCQGFSLNNRKRWDEDDRNLLFREFIRFVHIARPHVVVLENVSGLRSAGNGRFKEAIADAIQDAGYYVQFRVLNAADFGVPQKRQRVFFVGVRPGIEFRWPRSTHGAGTDSPWIGVWDAIGDLPALSPGQAAGEYDRAPFSDYQRFMRNGATVLLNHQAPNHPADVIRKIACTTPGAPMYPKFKQRIRLHPDEPSPTQVSGGIRPQFQFGHPNQPRGLTIRERCRIQSFPDTYEITGGTVQGRVQTGNAVPPLLARAIGTSVMEALRDWNGVCIPPEPRVRRVQLSFDSINQVAL
jgi:DNA (cytosine-5)-methyltransferase 1